MMPPLLRFLFLPADENGSASGTRQWFQLLGQYADDISFKEIVIFFFPKQVIIAIGVVVDVIIC
ncbi:hypothetical protein LWM68_01100 [Niabella sp. W65]|nr:hypothetical protein [Niabella sp. W65]MCH7361501.1 hypothetical protein [Niabella sp. W65]ULT45301.1 hypothetical protein KRR40_19685 [Niabella sp. I65]